MVPRPSDKRDPRPTDSARRAGRAKRCSGLTQDSAQDAWGAGTAQAASGAIALRPAVPRLEGSASSAGGHGATLVPLAENEGHEHAFLAWWPFAERWVLDVAVARRASTSLTT